jgi:two-component system phosphate regulon response regulator PhoB
MNKILVVDDDEEMTGLLATYLIGEGFQVAVARDGSEALRATVTQEPDLVLLDIVLGEEDGRDVLRELRLTSDVPVIFLTGRGLEAERVSGLKLGADDYIVKPFSLAEVSARIETVLRRAGVNMAQHEIDAPTMRFGDLLINETTHEVHVGGKLIDLTSKEFALLAFLAHSPRQVFTREQLLEQVWESSSEWQNEATVTEHVRRLRSKIEADPDHPRWIQTVRGVGYRFESEPGS